MKVIDLLNKIAKGEIPKTIVYDEKYFTYDEKRQNYFSYDDSEIDWKYTVMEYINDKVEIIEEPQEHKIPEKFEIYDNSIEWCCNGRSITDNEKDIMDKINEILDYLEINNGIMD